MVLALARASLAASHHGRWCHNGRSMCKERSHGQAGSPRVQGVVRLAQPPTRQPPTPCLKAPPPVNIPSMGPKLPIHKSMWNMYSNHINRVESSIYNVSHSIHTQSRFYFVFALYFVLVICFSLCLISIYQ